MSDRRRLPWPSSQIPRKGAYAFFLLPTIFLLAALTFSGCGMASEPTSTPIPLPTRDEPTPTGTEPGGIVEPVSTPQPAPTATGTPTPTLTLTPKPAATRWVVARLTVQPTSTSTVIAQTGVPLSATTPVPEPLGGKLVFALSPGGPIYSIQANGQELRHLTYGMDPAWSPDGRLIAFARGDPPRGLWVIGSRGNDERLVYGYEQLRRPAWGPDGRSIVFTRQHGGREAREVCFPRWGCFTLPADPFWRLGMVDIWDGAFVDIPSDLHSYTPEVAPDGAGVVYIGDQGVHFSSLNEHRETILVEGLRFSSPSFSPDGQRIVYMVYLHDHWDLFVISIDGGPQVPLTAPPSAFQAAPNNVAPAWSPDGRHIAFLSDRDGIWKPYIMRADGSRPEPFLETSLSGLTFEYHHAHERVMDWSP